jgi:hypothetical protein
MEKYLSAAETLSRRALFGPPPMAPTLTRLRSDCRRAGDARSVPAEYDVTGLSKPNAFHALYRVPVAGDYVIRVTLGGTRPLGPEPVTVALWIDEHERQRVTHDPERSASFGVDRQDVGGVRALGRQRPVFAGFTLTLK